MNQTFLYLIGEYLIAAFDVYSRNTTSVITQYGNLAELDNIFPYDTFAM